MKVKVTTPFYDNNANGALRVKGEILDVTEQRANELINFVDPVKKEKETVNTKTVKATKKK